jgi:hypothetical protein
MPTTYTMADTDAVNLMNRVIARRFPRLFDAAVKVGVLFARNPDGPALKHGGYEVLAHIRPVSLKDRLTKGYDAELVIDAAEYERLRPRQQEALFAHELRHIDTIDRGENDPDEDEGDGASRVTWKTDDLGRPRLKSVPGDWNGSDGFADVVAEYGSDAIEYENIARCKARADRARSAGESERGA